MKIGNRHATVVAYLALSVALGGSAFAVATVGSADIVNESIKSIDLKDGAAVTSADVKDAPSGSDAVNADKLDGKSLDRIVVKGRDVISSRRFFDVDPNGADGGVESAVLLEEDDLAIAARCVEVDNLENDRMLQVYVTGSQGAGVFNPPPNDTRVATADAQWPSSIHSDENGYRLLLMNVGVQYHHTSFSATAPGGGRISGLISGGITDVHGFVHDCVVDYTIFR